MFAGALFVALGSTAWAGCPTFLLLWGGAGTPSSAPGMFAYPTGICTDGAGTVYVSDNGNLRIEKFDAQGHLLGFLSGDDSYSLAWDEGQHILYVPNPNHGGVEVMTATGGYPANGGWITTPAGGAGPIIYVTLDARGTLFCSAADRIHVFDRDHNLVRTWLLPSPTLDPRGIAAGPDGRLYVGMATGSQVIAFDSTGTRVGSFPLPAGAAPRGMAFDASGALWVTIPNKDLVIQYSRNGTQLCSIGGGSRAVPGYVSQPYGVAVAPDGSVYTCDHGFHRVEHFIDAATVAHRSTWGSVKRRMR